MSITQRIWARDGCWWGDNHSWGATLEEATALAVQFGGEVQWPFQVGVSVGTGNVRYLVGDIRSFERTKQVDFASYSWGESCVFAENLNRQFWQDVETGKRDL